MDLLTEIGYSQGVVDHQAERRAPAEGGGREQGLGGGCRWVALHHQSGDRGVLQQGEAEPLLHVVGAG